MAALMPALLALPSLAVAGECAGETCTWEERGEAKGGLTNLYLEEGNYFGREWRNITDSIIETAREDDDIWVARSDPLILVWERFATADFIEKALKVVERFKEGPVDAEHVPWCMPAHLRQMWDELKRKGMTETPHPSSEHLCVSSPEAVKLLRETHGKGATGSPSTFLGRAVIDSEMDELEAYVSSRLGAANINEYAEDSNILEYVGAEDYTKHTDCSDARMNDRVFSLLVYLTSPEEGGATRFYHPEVNLDVAPERGRAVLFRNVGARRVRKCDERTQHEALAVGPGSTPKLVFQMWFNMRPISKTNAPSHVLCDGSGSCRHYAKGRETAPAEQLPRLGTEYRPALFRSRPGPVGSVVPRPYDVEDPYADHMGRATGLAGRAEKFKEALASFKAARSFSGGATDWGNLGFFMSQTAQKQPAGKRRTKLLKKSLKYFKQAQNRMASGRYDMALGNPRGYGDFVRGQIAQAESMLST